MTSATPKVLGPHTGGRLCGAHRRPHTYDVSGASRFLPSETSP
eukprot:SAG31_NODE_37992_length_300_cov_0.432836_1_plen_42_part_01